MGHPFFQTFPHQFHGTLEMINTRMFYYFGVVMKNSQTSLHFHIIGHRDKHVPLSQVYMEAFSSSNFVPISNCHPTLLSGICSLSLALSLFPPYSRQRSAGREHGLPEDRGLSSNAGTKIDNCLEMR